MEDLIIKGKKYLGRFQAEPKSAKYFFIGDTHEKHNYWWEGQGIIKKLDINEEKRFLFSSDKSSCPANSLEEGIVSFRSIYVSFPKRPEIKDYAGVVDAVLEQMYRSAEEQLANKKIIIPHVIVLPLDVEEVCEMGLVNKE